MSRDRLDAELDDRGDVRVARPCDGSDDEHENERNETERAHGRSLRHQPSLDIVVNIVN
jgi:hypothetical protein